MMCTLNNGELSPVINLWSLDIAVFHHVHCTYNLMSAILWCARLACIMYIRNNEESLNQFVVV